MLLCDCDFRGEQSWVGKEEAEGGDQLDSKHARDEDDPARVGEGVVREPASGGDEPTMLAAVIER